MKKKGLLILVSLFVISGLLMGDFVFAAPKPITLKLVKGTTLRPKSARGGFFLKLFVDEINKRAKGELIIKYLGGPEIMPGPKQPKAVQRGVFDMSQTLAPWYTALVPVGDMLLLSRLTWKEEQERGVFDYIRKLHRRVGLFTLGRDVHTNEPVFAMISKKRIEKLADFKGLIAASITTHAEAGARELGMSYSLVSWGDSYSGMERGMFDVFSMVLSSHRDLSLYEVAGYIIDHYFYSGNGTVIFNLDSWNGLPKHLQDLIWDVYFESQPELMRLYKEEMGTARQALKDKGIEFIKLSPAEGEQFSEIMYRAKWEYHEKLAPKIAPKLRKLLSK